MKSMAISLFKAHALETIGNVAGTLVFEKDIVSPIKGVSWEANQ